MPSTKKETIVIERVNQFGVRVNGKQYNFSKRFNEDSKAKFLEGETFGVEVYTSDGGAKYINAIIPSGDVPPKVAPKRITEPGPVPLDESSPICAVPHAKVRDFDKEALGKTRCVAACAALQSPALASLSMTKEELKENVLELADLIVKYSFQDKP